MLRFVVARLAAIKAIVIAIFHQAHIVFALAERAIVLHFALALSLWLVTLQANEWGSHSADSIAKVAGRKASRSAGSRLLTSASGCYL